MARLCVRAPRACFGPAVARTATGGITSAARSGAGGHVCVFAITPSVGRAYTAGVTWTSRTLSAQWAARSGHTTVIDAAGAIYVIGGGGFQDVWTDGGA